MNVRATSTKITKLNCTADGGGEKRGRKKYRTTNVTVQYLNY